MLDKIQFHKILDDCFWLYSIFFQRLVSQDIAFSSLFNKVLGGMLMWLDNPNVEGGPLKTLLKSFAGQNSHKHMHSDGKQPISAVTLIVIYNFLYIYIVLCRD